MKKKQISLIIIALISMFTLLTACGPKFGPIHPEAHSLLVYWQDANDDRDRGESQCQETLQDCKWNVNLNEIGKPNDPNKHQQCFNDFKQCTEAANKIFQDRINIRFNKACGATIFGNSNSNNDTDGDGITNYIELKMGLSPCHAQTFQGTNDADLDSDFDKEKNGVDKSPYCNPAYQADCV